MIYNTIYNFNIDLLNEHSIMITMQSNSRRYSQQSFHKNSPNSKQSRQKLLSYSHSSFSNKNSKLRINTHQSMKLKTQQDKDKIEIVTNIKMRPTETYFNRDKKKYLFCGIVDKYFENRKKTSFEPKIFKNNQLWIATHKQIIEEKKVKINKYLSLNQLDRPQVKTSDEGRRINSFFQGKTSRNLPIIQELSNINSNGNRCMSQHKRNKINLQTQQSFLFSEDPSQSTQRKAIQMKQPIQQQNDDKKGREIYKNDYYRIQIIENERNTKGKTTHSKTFTEAGQSMFTVIDKMNEFNLPKVWEVKNMKKKILYSVPHKSLRQQLYDIRKRVFGDQKIINIQTTKHHDDLFRQNCEWFTDIIGGIAKQLFVLNGKVINNKICLDNIQRIKEKDIRISDWGSSTTKNRIGSTENQLVFYHEGIFYDSSGWLIYPQYLAPEIIEGLMNGQTNLGIWEHSPDVWSLGLLIYELIALVPVWMPYKCTIGLKIVKKGLLASQKRNISMINEKQKKIQYQINKWIREERQLLRKVKPNIVNLMKRMLEYDAGKRPSPEQIIKQLYS